MPFSSRTSQSRASISRGVTSRKFSIRRSSILEQAVAYWRADSYKESLNQLNELTGSGVGGAVLGSSLTPGNTNSPTRLVYNGEKYVYLTGVNGNSISAPDYPALSITGDIDIVARLRIESISSSRGIVTQYSTTNNRSFAFFQHSNGTLRFDFTMDGSTAIVAASTVVNPVSVGTLSWVRVTRVSSTGAVTFYTSTTQTNSRSSVVWTQLGGVVGSTSGVLFDSTRSLVIGDGESGQFPMLGSIYYLDIRNSIDGTIVAKFEASLCDQAGYTDTINSNNTAWAINRSVTGKKSSLVERTSLLFGTDDYMEVPHHNLLNPDSGDFTALVFFRMWSDTRDLADLMSKFSGASTSSPAWAIESRSTTTNGFVVLTDASSNTAQGACPSITQGIPKICGFILDRNTQLLYELTNNEIPSSVSAATVGSVNPTNFLRFGREGNSANYTNFEFFAAMIFKKALSFGEIKQLTEELL